MGLGSVVYAKDLEMARRCIGSLKPRLFASIPGDAVPDPDTPSEPIVLALLVAIAL